MSGLGSIVEGAAELGMSTIGIKTKWLLMGAAVIGWSAFVAASANKLTRNHFKAGQVESLELRNAALVDSVKVKDGLLEQAMVVQGFSKEQMRDVLGAFVEVSVRQPKNTETIRTEIKDAPTKYAKFDPKQCLSYLFPDGMQDDQRRAIADYAADLPKFNVAGERIIQASKASNGAP